jgi:L-ascorbate metabolism protein UlaG (beta-lactamase superfamily)
MRIRWYGQSAFLLTGEKRVFIDPFGDGFRYPPIEGADADVLLVTHEHRDHNVVDVVGGEPPAAALARELQPRLVVPMHYRTEVIDFLEPPDEFLAALGAPVTRLETSEVDTGDVLGSRGEPVVVLLAPPLPE